MANNFNIFHRFLLICRFCGVAPPNLPSKSNIFHKVLSLLHILWSCCLLVVIVWGKYREYFDYLADNVVLVRLFVILEHVFHLTNCVIIIVGTNSNRHLYADYQERFCAIDRQFLQAPNINKQLSQYFLRFGLYLSFFILWFSTAILHFHQTPLQMFFAMCTYILPDLMIMMVIGKYLCVIHLLRLRLEAIVAELEALRDRTKTANSTVGEKSKSLFDITIVIDRLNKLRDVYQDVCNLASSMNAKVAWLLTGAISTCLCIITGQSFALYFLISRGNPGIVYYMFAAVYSTTNFAKIVILLLVNERFAWQVKCYVLYNYCRIHIKAISLPFP